MKLKRVIPMVAAMLTQLAWAAPTVHTTDFITVAQRTNLVDFEPMGSVTLGPPTFTQDGVTVTQVNGDPDGIWTGCSGCWFNNQSFSWYPDGGDDGWTEIAMANGDDFVDLGMDLGSGFGPGGRSVQYELRLNGSVVLSGSITTPSSSDGYLGFSGGGFDQVRLRNTFEGGGRFGDGVLNALAIDNIELAATGSSVPEPGPFGLIALGMLGLGAARRRAS